MGHVALFSDEPASSVFTAPVTPEEFWVRDWVPVMRLTRALLGYHQEAEDVAADIFEKLLSRRVYEMYRPDVVSKHTNKRVTWRAFLFRQVELYVRGKQEQVGRRLYREPLLCDATAGDGSASWVEMFGGQVWDDYPSLADSDFVLRIREQLAEMPECDGVSLLAMFEEILTLVKDKEKVTVSYLKKKFGVSAPDALAQIREIITGPAAVPVTFGVGGLDLTADEVREAAAALKAHSGNQVRPAFAAAGHRLAEAGTKWYLAFAAEEIAQFPELKVPKGTHKDGHPGRVKAAVIHRLERMTALAAVPAAPEAEPEPEETVTPQEVLESRLWQLGASAGDVTEIMNLAKQAFSA